jgi:hypothetical protein
MKWVDIKGTHINTNLILSFYWGDGQLIVSFAGDTIPTGWDDPDRELYVKLCHQMGVRPCEEVEHGEE